MELNWLVPASWPTLVAGDVHLWAVPLDPIETPWSELEMALSNDERERAQHFAPDEPRCSFVATRVALRTILGRYLAAPPAEIELAYDSQGKPRLGGRATERGVCFNVSHSGELALIAVAGDVEVGVDVERVRPVEHWHEIASRHFHLAELDAIRAAEPSRVPATFMRVWTRKEAVLKAVGTGLGYPLDAFSVVGDEQGGQEVDLPAHSSAPPIRCWLQDVDPCPGYLAAFATSRKVRTPSGFVYRL